MDDSGACVLASCEVGSVQDEICGEISDKSNHKLVCKCIGALQICTVEIYLACILSHTFYMPPPFSIRCKSL